MTKLTQLYLQFKTNITSFMSAIWSRLEQPLRNERRIETVAEQPIKPATE